MGSQRVRHNIVTEQQYRSVKDLSSSETKDEKEEETPGKIGWNERQGGISESQWPFNF